MKTHDQLSFVLPDARLRNYVSHYWLSRDNQDSTYSVIPDGSVDIVINIGSAFCPGSVFGTSTKFTDIHIVPGDHYLGICFKPGQSRHFIDTPASELTNSNQLINSQLQFDLLNIAELIDNPDIFLNLDRLLMHYLSKNAPVPAAIDSVIDIVTSSSGKLPILESAALLHKSTRQFERIFKQTVGISAKLYSQIIRFRRASELISKSNLPLAHIAIDLGYTDQSHMTRDFRRFANRTPASYNRNPVVFIQDQD